MMWVFLAIFLLYIIARSKQEAHYPASEELQKSGEIDTVERVKVDTVSPVPTTFFIVIFGIADLISNSSVK